MAMKKVRNGFSLIELMTVATIIAILAGLLIPAVTAVRRSAKETEQRAQVTSIELGIAAFKNDYGDYPPSSARPQYEPTRDYSGAQKLAEALVGWDLLGFHPSSVFRSDGEDGNGTDVYPTPWNLALNPAHEQNLRDRRGPYLELATANTFRINELFGTPGSTLAADTYVLCDVFGKRRLTLTNGEIVKAGTPILYYRAKPYNKDHDTDPQYGDRIYDVLDNRYLVDLGTITTDGSDGEEHPIADADGEYDNFYEFIRDGRMPIAWPYRPDSYILISAGADGKYGTKDDICNF